MRPAMENYIKGETLGEGTFGIVFKARHKEASEASHIEDLDIWKTQQAVSCYICEHVIDSLLQGIMHKSMSLTRCYGSSQYQTFLIMRGVGLWRIVTI